MPFSQINFSFCRWKLTVCLFFLNKEFSLNLTKYREAILPSKFYLILNLAMISFVLDYHNKFIIQRKVN